MRELRIVFMGTPDFAVFSLKKIVEAGYNVVGVITAPDKPAGRGRKLQQSAVKKYALEEGLKLMQPSNLKSEEFLEELKSLNPNLQVVVAFRMLPKSVWSLPEYGTFNLHASLLPQYRGAAPINWALINGEKTTGVSTFLLDEKIDTGAMLLQKEVEIEPQENAGQLHDKLMHTGAGLILDTLKLIESGKSEAVKQEESKELRPAPKLNKDNTRIDWHKSTDNIYNLIRGLNPYPAAWSLLINASKELKVKIFDIEKQKSEHHYPIGSITVQDKKLKVATSDGFIIISSIQLPGKRKMEVKDLLNGFTFTPDAKFL
ncbi:methionyl-tRNA formyltransferase [Salegentibacter chungangensis]|uniref:Methionyl-tRNA formyltransferase n=1 Tax=Salegentibacter chungangensis TaxID=1335724 RepID=A0ABW3NQ37_9FLAO